MQSSTRVLFSDGKKDIGFSQIRPQKRQLRHVPLHVQIYGTSYRHWLPFRRKKTCNHGNSIASMQLGSLWAMLRGKLTRKRVRPKVEGKSAKILQGPVWFLSSSRQTFWLMRRDP